MMIYKISSSINFYLKEMTEQKNYLENIVKSIKLDKTFVEYANTILEGLEECDYKVKDGHSIYKEHIDDVDRSFVCFKSIGEKQFNMVYFFGT